MSRVASKIQVTRPKALAEQFRIRPGAEIEWIAAGEVIRVVPPRRKVPTLDLEARLRLFEGATELQKRLQAGAHLRRAARDRGLRLDDLYSRGLTRLHQHPVVPVRSAFPREASGGDRRARPRARRRYRL